MIAGNGIAYSAISAIAIIGGLTFSTITSLYLVPLAYVLLLRLKKNTANMVNTAKLTVSKVIKA